MYTLSSKHRSYIVSDGTGMPMYFLSHDEVSSEEKGQDLLSQYLNDARGIFKSECDILLGVDRAFSDADAERLTIMLKLLIDARKTWQEEDTAGKCCPPVV